MIHVPAASPHSRASRPHASPCIPVGVGLPILARMPGVSAALVRAWECGQRKPSSLARRMLDLVRADPSPWRAMVEAA